MPFFSKVDTDLSYELSSLTKVQQSKSAKPTTTTVLLFFLGNNLV